MTTTNTTTNTTTDMKKLLWKKEMQDKRDSKMALNEKLDNVDAIMRQKALEDEEVLKAAGLYEYLGNDYCRDIERYLHMQVMECYFSLLNRDESFNEELANEQLTKEEKIRKYKYIYEEADMFARALKDYCVYKIIKG